MDRPWTIQLSICRWVEQRSLVQAGSIIPTGQDRENNLLRFRGCRNRRGT